MSLATSVGGRVGLDDAGVIAMRDQMTHRGPDGAGIWRGGHVVFGHRRLAVIDPTPAGAQPMVRGSTVRGSMVRGSCVLNYNGELYNDQEVRAALEAAGERFTSGCDTETVLLALMRWGEEALSRLRGMYALTFYDSRTEKLILARDPLGVKPLYWWRGAIGGRESIVAASEIPAITRHPAIRAEADLTGVSAYLTTIRTSVGERTLYKNVKSLRPGEAMIVSLAHQSLPAVRRRHWPIEDRRESDAGADEIRTLVEASVHAHLRSDVPMCSLLSGGLDSSIIVRVASKRVEGLQTFCSGTRGEGEDFEHARLVSDAFGVKHVEAPVDRERFGERWMSMIERMGMPLSTPNETAINEVARTLRAAGAVVTLSGEGADELFGGYGPAMSAAAAHVEAGNEDPAMLQLSLSTWIPVNGKAAVLNEDIWRGVEQDQGLIAAWRDEYAEAERCGPPGDPLQTHLRFQRRVNLTGLLSRLDSATMLESVEGRTPFSDRMVAEAAERLPMHRKFASPTETKVVLRDAFGASLPPAVAARQKASFPLPFQAWVGDHVDILSSSAFATSIFTPAAIEMVRREPEKLWNLAWPMINIAAWGDRLGG